MNKLHFHIIYLGSYFAFPLWGLSLVLLFFSFNLWTLITACVLSLFVYMRFVEPYWIIVRKEKMSLGQGKNLQIVLISDLHLGVYKDGHFFSRVADRIKRIRPDAVLIAGDLLFWPISERWPKNFAAIRKLNCPVFAVTGNHDDEEKAMLNAENVREKLKSIQFIDDQKIQIKGLEIIGLSDYWGKRYNLDLLDSAENAVVLTHNPDLAYEIKSRVGLVLCGHTHGGQIGIPLLKRLVVPCRHWLLKGWYKINNNDVFISSGMGEVMLPLRLLNRPEIVVFELEYS